MIIAFTGTSGSGKTTLIQHLKRWDFLKNRKIIIKKEDDFLTFKIIKLFAEDSYKIPFKMFSKNVCVLLKKEI